MYDQLRDIRQSRDRRRRLPIGGEPAPHPRQNLRCVVGAEPFAADGNGVGAMLSDFYRAEAVTDFLDAGKLAGFRVPPPRRE